MVAAAPPHRENRPVAPRPPWVPSHGVPPNPFRSLDRAAIVDAVPLAIPAVPFALVLGLAITEGKMPIAVGWLTAPLIFAGAAQLAVITLAGSASIWAVIVAGIVINTRHVMYSAAMAPTFRHQPRWMRWFGPYVLLDQVFALASLQTGRSPAAFRRYYLSAGFAFWVMWQVSITLGMVIGPIVPTSWRLEYAPPIMFIGLVLIGVNRVPQAVAAVVGGSVSLVAAGLQDRLGILVGAVAGVIAGAVAESRWPLQPAVDA